MSRADLDHAQYHRGRLLLGTTPTSSISKAELKQWVRGLADMGPRCVIITSVPEDEGRGTSVIAFDRLTQRFGRWPAHISRRIIPNWRYFRQRDHWIAFTGRFPTAVSGSGRAVRVHGHPGDLWSRFSRTGWSFFGACPAQSERSGFPEQLRTYMKSVRAFIHSAATIRDGASFSPERRCVTRRRSWRTGF